MAIAVKNRSTAIARVEDYKRCRPNYLTAVMGLLDRYDPDGLYIKTVDVITIGKNATAFTVTIRCHFSSEGLVHAVMVDCSMATFMPIVTANEDAVPTEPTLPLTLTMTASSSKVQAALEQVVSVSSCRVDSAEGTVVMVSPKILAVPLICHTATN